MTNFTYQDLDSYAQSLNQAKDLLADIEETMLGCYPDNDRTPGLQAALRQAQGLMTAARDLADDIRRLQAKDQDMRSAEATCNCSNPFCQV